MRFLLGIDGGGTRTTLALADPDGREIARRSGPAGIVDPRHPESAAEMLERLGAGADTAPGVAAEVLERVQGRLADAVEAAQRGVAQAVGSLRPDRQAEPAGVHM